MHFENALVKVQLTGEQLRRLLNVIIAKRDAQSGATLTYRTAAEGGNELVGVELSGKEINPTAVYSLITIDYLVNRGGDYAVLQEAKQVQPLGVTLRDAIIDYVRAQTAQGKAIQPVLDGRYKAQDGAPVAITKNEN